MATTGQGFASAEPLVSVHDSASPSATVPEGHVSVKSPWVTVIDESAAPVRNRKPIPTTSTAPTARRPARLSLS